MNQFKVRFNSLPVQMIISFVGLVLLTAVAAGVPALWLLNRQLQGQAWAQVEQGHRAAQALYAATQKEMDNLATLTAQRPTLQQLLAQGQSDALIAYMQTLKSGANLDLILVCNQSRQPLASTETAIPGDICALSGYQALAVTDSAPGVWLLSVHTLETGTAAAPVAVVVGKALNDEFVRQMRRQTGLEHTLLINLRPAATSLPAGLEARRAANFYPLEDPRRGHITLNNAPYYTLKFPLTESPPAGISAEVALPVANIAATQQRLVWTILGGILAAATVGSALGVMLARRISRPLARLADAATTLSQGDLTRSVMVDTRLREVALVGTALEAARVDLNLTLSDLRREKAWSDHLLAAIVEGIVMLDRQSQIVFFSPGAERITGWLADEVLGRSADEIFLAAETNQPFSQLLAAPQQKSKIAVNLRDGRPAILSVTSAQMTIPEENKARLVLVFRDVSETEAIHRVMGHFMANVTHEFRTPLSALAASIELLLDQAPDLSAAELQELITSLHLGIVGLQTLVDNLLEGASIEAGRFRVYARPVELNGIVLDAARTMRPLLTKYGQRLVIDLPPQLPIVRADPRRTVQVLVNLLSNASKYGPDQADVTLAVSLDGSQARVSIADHGPGIPPEHRGDLFQRFFYPAPGADRAQYGLGLGLSVVKAVVEAQGGQVGVEDRPGGGSIFWFTLAVTGQDAVRQSNRGDEEMGGTTPHTPRPAAQVSEETQ